MIKSARQGDAQRHPTSPKCLIPPFMQVLIASFINGALPAPVLTVLALSAVFALIAHFFSQSLSKWHNWKQSGPYGYHLSGPFNWLGADLGRDNESRWYHKPMHRVRNLQYTRCQAEVRNA